eukprot:CAMPEP_0175862168 /NCGR_PEP_ID=MMETSP0107_2-20121207/31796_1 /TAXON_ID=195067 ORGANISM="Goniomonas pacifica, Strain CCMP1869" /NCGR_SAMPLE_ID=MMETSP0107_2 /ASSEMBLY_ACC=CAM_ASM_000203 /LENGTH=47 /DNA_ID= /DNA_START= /DNA_END= /DNA_ORIENTATION=
MERVVGDLLLVLRDMDRFATHAAEEERRGNCLNLARCHRAQKLPVCS